ncbi:glycosyltransferase [Methylobacillus arboreus]|uniref:glycosyltransferase n=1 Tax=Methylobacillus arboreus TaxID=755170 RepID=UPI001E2D35D5|nr:glycosyltransferase [Methylobacillus arboreus]MCB5191588.1 glycosyltransferase [Methylobacillus arboreus]
MQLIPGWNIRSSQILSRENFAQLCMNAEVLEQDERGIKVLQLENGHIFKVFRVRHIFSLARVYSYARQFCHNADRLKTLAIPTVEVMQLFHFEETSDTAVLYKPLPGHTLRQLSMSSLLSLELMQDFGRFVARLHQDGIYFRSLHFGNVVRTPQGEFGLIDIADLNAYRYSLTESQRARNFRHLQRYRDDWMVLPIASRKAFADSYFSTSQLPAKMESILRPNFNSCPAVDMYVLHICHSYYPPFLDCARQYAALFKDSPYKVVTVYLTGRPDPEVERGSASDEVIFLGYSSKQVRGLKLGAIARIRKLVKSRNFAFCIAHRAKPTYVALLATNLPVVSVHHNYNDFGRVSRRLLVNLCRKRLLMLCVSNSVRDEMRRHLRHWPAEQIQTLYNRIDLDAVKQSLLPRGQARQVLELDDDAYVIANVGRLHRDKDQATLLRGFSQALPSLPANALLLILGKGPLEQELKALAKTLEIAEKVRFAGQVPDARRYFKAFDLFVLASDHEPFGMVLLEAMAAELPIICSDSGGGAEVVRDFAKFFTLGNEESLSKAMVEVVTAIDEYPLKTSSEILSSKFSDDAARVRFFQLINTSWMIDKKR